MRVPYVVGRWVRGNNHYGRQHLIEYLLSIEDDAVWVVGTRRIGKTSLLRQIEFQTQHHATYVPLFWDLQGCETVSHLSEELFYSIEDVLDRFEPLGVTTDDFANLDAIEILRMLNRKLASHQRRLLLLIDETEALISISEHDGAWLARLRKLFQRSEQRTIATSTILLSKLNDANSSWDTSPFLFGFRLANLWKLSGSAANDLVRQVQTGTPIAVSEVTVRDVLNFTNGHPYLIQYLCQQLFLSDDQSSGRLRPVHQDDLTSDQLLAGFFQIDFLHLSQLERRLLLLIAQESVASVNTLYELVPGEPPNRMQHFLYGMEKMGHIRRIGNYWTVGNEFLRRWLLEHMTRLSKETPSMVSDTRFEELVNEGAHQEVDYLRQEISRLQQSILSLDSKSNHETDAYTRSMLHREVEETKHRLHTLERSLSELTKNFGGNSRQV